MNSFVKTLIIVFTVKSVHGIIQLYANKESTFVLKCPSKVKPSTTMVWRYGNITVNSGSAINPTLPNKDRLSINGDINNGEYNLQITQVQQSDGGQFNCSGANVNSTLFSYAMNLIITEPPTKGPVIFTNPSGAVVAGVSITVTCEVTGGKPLASIFWECSRAFNLTQEIAENIVVSNVQLTASKADDDKVCRCVASHPLWTTNNTAEVIINVLYPPDLNPSIQQTPSGAIITGNKVILTCTVSGGNPLATLAWDCTSTTINNTSGNTASYSVELTVDKTYNDRICTCSATHPDTSYRPTVQYRLVVYYPPDLNPSIQQTPSGAIITGNKVTLTCTVSGGNPLATLAWDCTGTTTNNTSGNTASYSVELTVDKIYNGRICTCSAKHPVTTYNPTVQLELVVYYSPDIRPVIQQTPTGPIITGNKVTLTCTVSGGNPLATLVWDCTGTTTNNTSGNTASYSVDLTVDKTYNDRICTCSATHPDTSYRPTVQYGLVVYYSPDIRPIIQQIPSGPIITGNKVTLTCTVSGGNPLATLYWDCTGTITNNTSGNTASYSVELTVDKTFNDRICTCSATHPVSSYRPTVQHGIVVYYQPDTNPNIQQTPRGAIITGNNVTLTCTVSGGNPLASLSLNCTGATSNNTSGSTTSLSVELTVDKTYNGRICTCLATHPVNSYKHTVEHGLVVYYSPDTNISIQQTPLGPIITGYKVTLTCTVSGGNPLATLSWNCNGLTTNNTSGNTASYSVELTVDKTYNNRICTCSATHPDTSYRPTVQYGLVVYYEPDTNPIIQQTPPGAIITGNNVTLKCTVSGGNPLVTLSWNCSGTTTNTTSRNTASYSIDLTVDKSYNGKICTCSSRHPVTSYRPSVDHNLVIYFAPEVTVALPHFELEEGMNVTLACNASGNPSTYTYHSWTHMIGSEIVRTFKPSEKLQLIRLSYRDIGNYSCQVDNNIADHQNKVIQSASTTVEIYFRPIFVDYDVIVSTKEDDNLTTSVKLFSYPDIKKPIIWINDSDNSLIENGTNVFITFEQKPITTLFYGANVTVDRFSYESTLHFSRFQRSFEGFYTLQVNNTFCAANLPLQIVISDKPHTPKRFRVTLVTSTTVTLSWAAGFNGGNPQTFIIKYKKINSADDISLNRSETFDLKEYDMEIRTLLPSTTYIFSIFAANIEGIASLENNTLTVETLGAEGTVENSIIGPVAGGLSGIVVAICAVIVIIIYIRRLKGKEGKDHSRALTKHLKKSDDDSDDLHDNILYESAGPSFKSVQGKPDDCGVDYATVNKDRKIHRENKDIVQDTRLHSEVKESPNGKVKGKKDATHLNTKKRKEQMEVMKTQTDDVYENMDEEFQNGGFCRKPVDNRNVDGLQYADLIFNPSRYGAKFIIHGLEERTIYAQVDTTQKIDPLPDSDHEAPDTEPASKFSNEN